MYAHLVRYEVAHSDNAESFIDEVMAQFNAMQHEVAGLVGSFLLTRRDDGEALQITFWDSEDDARSAEAVVCGEPAPDTGIREVVTGRRAEVAAGSIWDVWQGHQAFKSD